MPEPHRARRDRLRQLLREAELDAALVTDLVNVRYLTGFTGSNAALLVSADGAGADPAVFATDGRYETQSAAQVPELPRVLERVCAPALARRAAADGHRLLGFEAHHVTVEELQLITDAAAPVPPRPMGHLVERLRVRKSAEEIELLGRACAIADTALAQLLEAGGVRPGRSEREVALDLDWRMLQLGAEAVSFETIVASGENSAIPHHRPTGRELAAGDFVKFDFGATYGGYHSDMTRTLILAPARPWQEELYQLVAQAQRVGREAVRVGADVRAVDAAARSVIDAAGYGERFSHGLGHGVGLQVHEAPNLSPRGAGTLPELAAVTVEPGVYLPGRGGVRIEDTLVVEDAGARLLTQTGRDLVIV